MPARFSPAMPQPGTPAIPNMGGGRVMASARAAIEPAGRSGRGSGCDRTEPARTLGSTSVGRGHGIPHK
jgi:hypothetical protein